MKKILELLFVISEAECASTEGVDKKAVLSLTLEL